MNREYNLHLLDTLVPYIKIVNFWHHYITDVKHKAQSGQSKALLREVLWLRAHGHRCCRCWCAFPYTRGGWERRLSLFFLCLFCFDRMCCSVLHVLVAGDYRFLRGMESSPIIVNFSISSYCLSFLFHTLQICVIKCMEVYLSRDWGFTMTWLYLPLIIQTRKTFILFLNTYTRFLVMLLENNLSHSHSVSLLNVKRI